MISKSFHLQKFRCNLEKSPFIGMLKKMHLTLFNQIKVGSIQFLSGDISYHPENIQSFRVSAFMAL